MLHLADTEGIEAIAEAWADRPADTIAGCLWRLYLLRSWVYADPVGVAREFEAGRARAAVDGVVAGVADPPGPDELRDMVDQVLRGIAASDFADVLLRAAAFARVVATGRVELPDGDTVGRRPDPVGRRPAGPRSTARARRQPGVSEDRPIRAEPDGRPVANGAAR